MIRLLSIQSVAERGGSDQLLVRMVRSLPSDEFDCHVVRVDGGRLRGSLAIIGAPFLFMSADSACSSCGDINCGSGVVVRWSADDAIDDQPLVRLGVDGDCGAAIEPHGSVSPPDTPGREDVHGRLEVLDQRQCR
jgi:hypothetical protein